MITVREAQKIVTFYADERRTKHFARSKNCSNSIAVSAKVPTSGVIGHDVYADRDMPPFDRVVMDGVAIRFADFEAGVRSFAIEGIQAAGKQRLRLNASGACLEVMTGALAPQGCDTVIRYEDLVIDKGQAILRPGVIFSKGQNIHVQGSDHKKGELLIAAGTRITPPCWAVLATVGCREFPVLTGPHISILGTGDELVALEAVPEEHQIRASNGCAIHAACLEFGYGNTNASLVGDSKPHLREALVVALEKSDVVVLTGAVSAGKFDLVPEVLRELGVKELFHKVAQRPGKPLWFGVSEAGQLVFGLPGNPVSALVSFYRYVLPALERLRPKAAVAHGEDVDLENVRYAKLRETLQQVNDTGLSYFLPAKLEHDQDGSAFVRVQQISSSGNLMALLKSDGFVELPSEQQVFLANDPVRFFSWRSA